MGVFIDDLLIPNPEYLISGPSNGSEQGGLVDGASMDHQIMGDLFCHLAAVGRVLTLDAALGKHLLVKADIIEPARIGKYGQLWEWVGYVEETSKKHRHVSHLWAVNTGNKFN